MGIIVYNSMPEKQNYAPDSQDDKGLGNDEQKKTKNIETEAKKQIKVLIVEDQGYPQFILLKSLQSGFADQIDNFSNGQDVLIIDNYQDALKLLEDENFDYQVVLLDNRVNIESIPIDKRGKPIKIPIQGVKPDAFQIYDDPEDYSDYPKTDAYNLISKFKEKGATVIGTSSMSQEELKRKNLPTPDFQINKLDSEEMLANLKGELLEKLNKDKE